MVKVMKRESSRERWSIDGSPRSNRNQAITASTRDCRVWATARHKLEARWNHGTQKLAVKYDRDSGIRCADLLIRRHDIRHRALELFCGRALAHHAAKGCIARHFGIAPAPGHPPFGIEPDQPLRTL